jgi:predicted thioesterase
MKDGLDKGLAQAEFVVTDEMVATLDGRLLHPVCSTFWMVYFAEVAARRAIEPFFEEGEDAVGSLIELRHLAMAAVGAHVLVSAQVREITGNRIRCDVRAISVNKNTLLAEGIQDQVVMRTEVLASKIAAAVR